MRGREQSAAVLIIASLLATALFLPATHAADNRGHLIDSGYPLLNYTLHNGTLPDVSFQQEHSATPAPITIYHFELDQTSLPGPRYMAYGPSVISLAVDPRLFAVLIAICAIIALVWYLLPRNGEEEE